MTTPLTETTGVSPLENRIDGRWSYGGDVQSRSTLVGEVVGVFRSAGHAEGQAAIAGRTRGRQRRAQWFAVRPKQCDYGDRGS
jgi:hypothetical protein